MYHIGTYIYHCPYAHQTTDINHPKWCIASKPKKLLTYNTQKFKPKTHSRIHINKTCPKHKKTCKETTLCVLESRVLIHNPQNISNPIHT